VSKTDRDFLKLWYNARMNHPPMTKAKYGKQFDPEADLPRQKKNLNLMREGGWFNGPQKPDQIKKHFEVFRTRKHNRAKIIYTMLISRSYELGGVTKFSNKAIQLAMKEHFQIDITVSQVNRCLRFLENAGVIATLTTYLPSKTNETKPRANRMFMVWASFFASRCRAKTIGWSGLKSDSRVECQEWQDYIASIPLEYKIKTPVTVRPKNTEPYEVSPAAVDWDTLAGLGVIDNYMHLNISDFTYGRDLPGNVSKYLGIMGRTENFMHYSANKTEIDKKRAEYKQKQIDRLIRIKEDYGIM
jgi:hypothetical protein